MNKTPITSMISGKRDLPTSRGSEDVIEIGLLLPTNRAAALLHLARERQQSVGQVLRNLIDRALAESA